MFAATTPSRLSAETFFGSTSRISLHTISIAARLPEASAPAANSNCCLNILPLRESPGVSGEILRFATGKARQELSPKLRPADAKGRSVCCVSSQSERIGHLVSFGWACRAEASAGGGDGGIRTLDRALQPYNGLANRRLQPLGHVSGCRRYARRCPSPQAADLHYPAGVIRIRVRLVRAAGRPKPPALAPDVESIPPLAHVTDIKTRPAGRTCSIRFVAGG